MPEMDGYEATQTIRKRSRLGAGLSLEISSLYNCVDGPRDEG